MQDAILVRYDEIGTKGKNRSWFEDILVENIQRSLGDRATVRKFRGRIEILPRAETNRDEVLRLLAFIPGISSYSSAIRLPFDASWEEIVAAALPFADQAIAEGRTVFRVSCTRSNKRYPLTSPEVQKKLAAAVLTARDKCFTVSMTNYTFELEIEIAEDGFYLFSERRPGTLGLPVGCAGEVLTLLSGGIDSPVAAYLTMRRGARTHYLSFHSPPYTTEESIKKLVDIAHLLSRYQGTGSHLIVVPFIDIQLLVKARCQESYRTIVFRRLMFRIAEQIARTNGWKALVTGESLSQVASQTLENLTCINDAVEILPVLRPLITNEKKETIAIAQRIGTFDISIRPCPDSCTAFLPRHPITRGRLETVRSEEKKLYPEMDDLMRRAITEAMRFDV